MAIITGEATANAEKKVLLVEALQQALDDAPPPGAGFDVQNFKLLSVELEFGGFVGSTVTRVTVSVEDGPLPGADSK